MITKEEQEAIDLVLQVEWDLYNSLPFYKKIFAEKPIKPEGDNV